MLKAAKAKDVELQYYKNLAKKYFHLLTQLQTYKLQFNASIFIVLKSKVKLGFNDILNSISQSKSQL